MTSCLKKIQKALLIQKNTIKFHHLKFKWFIKNTTINETETHKEVKRYLLSTNQKGIHIQNVKNYHKSIRKKDNCRVQNSSGVSGYYIDMLPGPSWNYNYNTEKPSRGINWRLARKNRIIKDRKWRLVRSAKVRMGWLGSRRQHWRLREISQLCRVPTENSWV